MRTNKLFALLACGLFLCGTAVKAEELPIRWVVQDGYKANKLQAGRLYLEACRWVEDHYGSKGQTIRPALTIRVGESCPDPAIKGACLGSWSGDLYIPKWDKASPGDVVQVTLSMSLLELMSRQQRWDVTRNLLADDVRNFLDAPMVAQQAEK